MIDGAFAYAFTAGMVATVNPCGFAMLPAYLSYFLGIEGHGLRGRPTGARRLARLVVSAAVAARLHGRLRVRRRPWSTPALIRSSTTPSGLTHPDRPGAHRARRGRAARLPPAVHHAAARPGRPQPHGRRRCSSSACPTRSRRSGARCRSSSPSSSAASPARLRVGARFGPPTGRHGPRARRSPSPWPWRAAVCGVAPRDAVRRPGRRAFLVLAGAYLVYYWIFNLATRSPAPPAGPATSVEARSARLAWLQTGAPGASPFVLVAALGAIDRRRVRPAPRPDRRSRGDAAVFDELLGHPGWRRWSSCVRRSGSWPSTAARWRR